MSASALLRELHDAGFVLEADGERLIVRPGSALSAEQRAAIQAAKGELVALLEGATVEHDGYPVAGECARCGRYAWRPRGTPATGWVCRACKEEMEA